LTEFKVITISEGAAGMRSQIEGLANIISNNYINFDVILRPFFKKFPVQLIPAKKFAYKNLDEIIIKEKTIVISCGKKSIKASLILKEIYHPYVFNIHIQDPKTKYGSFDLILSPEHDNLNKPNSLSTTLALHNIKFKKKVNEDKIINFIIGGPNKYFKFDQKVCEKLITEIIYLSKNYKINVIPSRRTPISFIKKLNNHLISKNIFIFKDIFNPIEYGNLLSNGSFQIVTWDSISMISEAISSEISTYIYRFEEKNCPHRYGNFYQNIVNKNLARFYNGKLDKFNPSLGGYNNEIKSKILNKIESHLWFRSNAS
tara:strand:+ start:3662 stop:4606 length:945 start_codon:yes stop_codon:yes gene_type:complete